MDLSIYGVLQWVQVNDLKVVAAQSASNLLLALYVISYISNRKAAFLVAFLLVEFYGNLNAFSGLSSFGYYLGYALIYSMFYWFVLKQYHIVKSSLGYGILTLFETVMSLDALYFPNVETYIYTHYASIVVLVHLYIIASTINWRALRTRMGASFNAVGSWMGANYNLSFFWYTLFKST